MDSLVSSFGLSSLPYMITKFMRRYVVHYWAVIGMIVTQLLWEVLAHLASTLTPLYNLLKKHTPWRWDHDEDGAFKNTKQLLTSAMVLTPYNPIQSEN